jgi:hypothetical protein
MSFQCFSRQSRGDPSGTQEEKVPNWKKKHVIYNGGGIPIYWHPSKEIPPRGEHPVPSILSLLLSETKMEGKAERPSGLQSPYQCGLEHI